MRRPCHLHLALLVLLATSFATAVSSAPLLELQKIRVGKTPERTRFVFDVSGATGYHFFRLGQPARVVIDLQGITGTQTLPVLSLEDTPITAIRTGIQADGTVRYTFVLETAVVARAFALPPNASRGHRVVLDIDNAVTGKDIEAPTATIATTASQVTTQTPPVAKPPEIISSQTDQPPPAAAGSTAREDPQADPGGEWTGYLSLDSRLFFGSPAYAGQRDQDASVAVQPEYYREWDRGQLQFSFIPFARLDSSDSERTHADIRQLYWRRQFANWSVKAGVDVVFWGVAESQHLVDIINQTDLVENIDGEEKLGQPMVTLDYMGDWGNWQLYLLPYFRERTYPGKHGRLRTDPKVDVNNPVYDASDEEQHVDFALRWSHYLGDWDIGLGYFSGTIRNPLLLPSGNARSPTLTPYYPQIEQASLDLQATKGAWLWKLEAIYNQNKLKDYYAYVGGFEYTRFGVAGTGMDLGWLLEYNYDERGKRSFTVLQDDIYLGLRLAGNDIDGSALLAGIVVDTDNHSTFVNIEAARRIGESWTLTLETRLFTNIDREDAFYFIRADDYLGIALSRYF